MTAMNDLDPRLRQFVERAVAQIPASPPLVVRTRTGTKAIATAAAALLFLVAAVGGGALLIEARNLVASHAASAEPTTTIDGRDLASLPLASGASDPRSEVIARVRGLSGEVVRVDRIEAKQMRWSDLEKSAHTGNALVDDRQIWAVAVAGEIRPAFGHGQSFSWGVFIIDARTNDIYGLNAGHGSWPPYFEGLPDQP
jgi:hypothetical protein